MPRKEQIQPAGMTLERALEIADIVLATTDADEPGISYEERLRRLTIQGLNITQIAQAVKVPRTTLKAHLENFNLHPESGRGPLPKGVGAKLDVDLVRLHAEGLTDRELGERLGIGRKAVTARRTRLNLPINPQRRDAAA